MRHRWVLRRAQPAARLHRALTGPTPIWDKRGTPLPPLQASLSCSIDECFGSAPDCSGLIPQWRRERRFESVGQRFIRPVPALPMVTSSLLRPTRQEAGLLLAGAMDGGCGLAGGRESPLALPCPARRRELPGEKGCERLGHVGGGGRLGRQPAAGGRRRQRSGRVQRGRARAARGAPQPLRAAAGQAPARRWVPAARGGAFPLSFTGSLPPPPTAGRMRTRSPPRGPLPDPHDGACSLPPSHRGRTPSAHRGACALHHTPSAISGVLPSH